MSDECAGLCSCGAALGPAVSSDACCPKITEKPYQYGPAPWTVGEVSGPAGPIPLVATQLTVADRLGAWRVRWGIRRADYRVTPGLYAVGEPGTDSPVLVTANYKLTFDSLRSQLGGIDAWILVLDTRGVNVWCAAGKGTFSTEELATRVKSVSLDRIVSHRRLILPQLGAVGVAGHLVRQACGFSVTFGPIRAVDLPCFLAAGMKADAGMRGVRFSLRDRMTLIPVEASIAWKWQTLAAVAALAFLAGVGGSQALSAGQYGVRVGELYGLVLLAVVAGSVIVPAALPWIPGRAFSVKGALVGGVLAAVTTFALREVLPLLALIGIFLAATGASSYLSLNFTGSTPFTSPSGVEKEMRRALPWQVGGGLLAVLLFVAQFIIRLLDVTLP